jgi:hypothetical protein
MRRAAVAICSLVILAASGTASAQIPPILKPGTHPFWGALSLGPAIGLNHSAGVQFKLIETIGYHFMGAAEGPAIAFDLQEAFGNSYTSIELGPKFVWDIQPLRNLGLYLSPSFMIGYAWAGASCSTDWWSGESCSGTSGSAFDMQIGFEAKLILADRALVFFRPMTIDILIRDPTFVRWDLMFGGGAIF